MAITGTSDSRPPRIRLGMVGGGRDAFIGGVHRIAPMAIFWRWQNARRG